MLCILRKHLPHSPNITPDQQWNLYLMLRESRSQKADQMCIFAVFVLADKMVAVELGDFPSPWHSCLANHI